jgi:hypothetical protein
MKWLIFGTVMCLPLLPMLDSDGLLGALSVLGAYWLYAALYYSELWLRGRKK